MLLVANGLDWAPGDNVIVPDIEYPSNVYCWMNLRRHGVGIKWVKSRDGRVLVEDIAPLIDQRTRLVTLSAVQFSNGFRQDLMRTAELCQSRNVLLNLDAIQHIGALHFDASRCPVDFLSAGGHKWLLGPIGTGFFFCRRSALDRLRPANVGYHSVAKDADHLDYDLVFRPDAGRFEEALVNFPGLWGLEAAVDLVLALGVRSHRAARPRPHVAPDRRPPRTRVPRPELPATPDERSGIVTFRHPTRRADELHAHLQAARIDVALCLGALRASPGAYNDGADIQALLETLP